MYLMACGMVASVPEFSAAFDVLIVFQIYFLVYLFERSRATAVEEHQKWWWG